jgi:phosphoribosylamine---glycine ligase
MKVLIIGSGGREDAIVGKISQNEQVDAIYCAPGNGGTYNNKKCENINLSKIDDLLQFALEKKIDLTIVGPEEPLVNGIVDKFRENGLKIFGPTKKAAQLEGSKAFSKQFMKKYGIKTAEYGVFTNKKEAVEYLKQCDYPIVVKADGLAAGKGVCICEDFNQAEGIIDDYMINDIFNGAGRKIVIEEFLEGIEASILSITDGETIIPFISCMDHKQIYDGNKGPNTGGMGSISPNPVCTEEVLKEFNDNIMQPTLKGIKKEQLDFIGIVFFGIMICKKGVYLLEYNVRMGDPETQAVLPLMKSDFIELILCALNKKLFSYKIDWHEKHSCCVVATSNNYPGKYETGYEITNYSNVNNKLYIAGANYCENKLVTTGGRVLAVTATNETLDDAIKSAYDDIKKIKFSGIYFRKDIGNSHR